MIPLTITLTGCSVFGHRSGLQEPASLAEAREMAEAGELYEAKKFTTKFIQQHPTDSEAQELMAQILDKEISRQKEIFETKPIEEFTSQEKSNEIQTWLERAQALLQLKQYDQALLAAEKVFQYDAENAKASRLIDDIRAHAYKEGKKDSLVVSQMVHGEIEERVEQYRKQAEDWIEKGQWGAARLAVEKILLLEPEDRDALKLQEKIQSHKQ